MLDIFLRPSRAGSNIRSQERGERALKALEGVCGAIDQALSVLQADCDQLESILAEAGDRASITAGNAYDEYLTRESTELSRIRDLEAEMRRSTRALATLRRPIEELRVMQTSLRALCRGLGEEPALARDEQGDPATGLSETADRDVRQEATRSKMAPIEGASPSRAMQGKRSRSAVS